MFYPDMALCLRKTIPKEECRTTKHLTDMCRCDPAIFLEPSISLVIFPKGKNNIIIISKIKETDIKLIEENRSEKTIEWKQISKMNVVVMIKSHNL